jgi:hypothetical protein
MVVMFLLFGMLGTVAAVAGFFIHRRWDAEGLLPDVVAPHAACAVAH